jgi:hypothetical protein
MAYVPGFEYDVFISYASDDFDDKLDNFVQDLRIYLTRALGKDFSEHGIFLDRQELNIAPAQWKQKLRQSVKSAAMLVPILTPSYANSDYCAKEWEWFYEERPLSWKAKTETVFRVCPVHWRSIDAELLKQVSPEIRSAQEDRTLSAEKLGLKIVNGLRLMRQSRPTVYIGETEHDIRKKLREEMSRLGLRVVPESPMAYGDDERVRTLLGEARMAIHFVGGQHNKRAFDAIRSSCKHCRFATVVYQLPGLDLEPDEQLSLGAMEKDLPQPSADNLRVYDQIGGKSFEQFLQLIQDRLERVQQQTGLRETHPLHRAASEKSRNGRLQSRRWWFGVLGGAVILIAALLYFDNPTAGRNEDAAFRVGGQLALAGGAPSSLDPVQLDRDSTILSITAGRIADVVQRIRGDGDPGKRIAATDWMVDELSAKLTEADRAFLRLGYGSTGVALAISRWDGSSDSEKLAVHYWLDLSAGIQPARALRGARDALHSVNPTMLADPSGRNKIRRALNYLAPYAAANPELNKLFGGSKSWTDKEER